MFFEKTEIVVKLKYNINTEYPPHGWAQKDFANKISKGHNFMGKGQTDSAVPKSLTRLICPKNMKLFSFIVSEQCVGQGYQGNSHTISPYNLDQNNPAVHMSYSRFTFPENIKHLRFIVSKQMAWIKLLR